MGANLSLPIVAPAIWSSLKLSAMDIDLAVESARSSKLELINHQQAVKVTGLVFFNRQHTTTRKTSRLDKDVALGVGDLLVRQVVNDLGLRTIGCKALVFTMMLLEREQ